MLHHYQCFTDIDDKTVEQMLAQMDDKLDKIKSQHWVTLTSLFETRPEAFCLFIENLMDKEEQGADANTQTDKIIPRGTYSDIGPRLSAFHLDIQLDGKPFTPDINGAPRYLLKFGNPHQKRKALEFIKGRAEYLLGKLPSHTATGYLREMLLHPVMDCVEEEWEGYPEYLKKRYLAGCLKPDANGRFSSSAHKVLRFLKNERFIPGYSDWCHANFGQKQQELKDWCESQEKRFSTLPVHYERS